MSGLNDTSRNKAAGKLGRRQHTATSVAAADRQRSPAHHHGDVDAGVGLARDVELVALVLGEGGEPGPPARTQEHSEPPGIHIHSLPHTCQPIIHTHIYYPIFQVLPHTCHPIIHILTHISSNKSHTHSDVIQ